MISTLMAACFIFPGYWYVNKKVTFNSLGVLVPTSVKSVFWGILCAPEFPWYLVDFAVSSRIVRYVIMVCVELCLHLGL